MSNELTTVDEVIDALGGTSETAKLVGRNSQAVSNWRARKQIPPETFVVLSAELRSRALSAPVSLWGMVEPKADAAAQHSEAAE